MKSYNYYRYGGEHPELNEIFFHPKKKNFSQQITLQKIPRTDDMPHQSCKQCYFSGKGICCNVGGCSQEGNRFGFKQILSNIFSEEEL
jgi:hypothetical protein